jgi:tight adherence protein C
MSSPVFVVAISILAASAVVVLLYAGMRLYQDAPISDRQFMDPLPFRIKLVWPIIRSIAEPLERVLSVEYVEAVRIRLVHSGSFYLYTPYEFVALRIITAVLFAIAAAVMLELAGIPQFPWFLVAGVFGYFAPAISMGERSKKREKEIVRMLPTFLDFITMSVEAGLSLTGALNQAVSKGPPSLFRVELERVNRDVKAGAGRVEALQAMADRLQIREVSALVNAIAVAERTGGSVGNVLRAQSDQRLAERFQRAEKQAMEAPVKLIFPLVAFIFPSTFLMLFFPLAMKLLHGG